MISKSTGLIIYLARFVLANIHTVQEADSRTRNCFGINLQDLDIASFHSYVARGEITSSQLTQCYIKRSVALNSYLNAIIEINPDAQDIASQADAGKLSGPLRGVPILLKDNIATYDKMQTTAGTLALVDHLPQRDAQLVSKLRRAGAVILGKTNLSELSGFKAYEPEEGYSARGGLTKNPHQLDNTASGSSSGSAAAIAASLALVSIGTETDGSLISPSSVCGVIGYKPTFGTISTDGTIPVSKTQDTVGIISNTVQDAVTVIKTIGHNDGIGRYEDTDFTAYWSYFNISGTRIGVLGHPYYEGFTRSEVQKIKNAISGLERFGTILTAGLELKISLEEQEEGSHNYPDFLFTYGEYEIFKSHFKTGLEEYLKKTDTSKVHPLNRVKDLDDLVAYNKKHHITDPRKFGQYVLEQAKDSQDATSEEIIKKSIQFKEKISNRIIKLMEKNNLDAIVSPTNSEQRSFSPPGIAGFPVVNVPVGMGEDGIPLGVSVFSTSEKDVTVLKIARAMEMMTKRLKPKFSAHKLML